MPVNTAFRLSAFVLLLIVQLTRSEEPLAYECIGGSRSTDTQRFDDNHDGTLTDIDNGLTWMRCAVGQRWESNTCLGQATLYDWHSAQQAAQQFNQPSGYAGHKDWRLPKLPELAGIIERHCNDPRANLQLFPATPAAYFWTANTKPQTDDQAYAMDFGPNGVSPLIKSQQALVRLVRGRQ